LRHHRLLIRSVLEALKLKDSLGVVDDSLDRLGILTPKTARETLDGKGLEGGSHVGGVARRQIADARGKRADKTENRSIHEAVGLQHQRIEVIRVRQELGV